jgi:hypothetical protein
VALRWRWRIAASFFRISPARSRGDLAAASIGSSTSWSAVSSDTHCNPSCVIGEASGGAAGVSPLRLHSSMHSLRRVS